jgi:hypothetical protein
MSWGYEADLRGTPAQPEPTLAADRFSSLTDEFLDSWVHWREACEDAHSAYECWKTCEPPQRGIAFASYGAALDREEHAARIHSDWTERLRASAAG